MRGSINRKEEDPESCSVSVSLLLRRSTIPKIPRKLALHCYDGEKEGLTQEGVREGGAPTGGMSCRSGHE